MGFYGYLDSLLVLLRPYLSLWVLIGPYLFLQVFLGPCSSL